MTRIEALSKVKKLLAMTTERGCTEAEAQAAAGLAAKIMMAHDIEAAAMEVENAEPLADTPPAIWDDPLDTSGSKWKYRLALAIAHSFGCEVMRQGAGMKLVGRAHDVQVVRYVYAYCAREVARITNEKAMGNGRGFVFSYRLGLIDAIRGAIRKEQEAARREATEAAQRSNNPHALVRVSNAIAKANPDAQYRATQNFVKSLGWRYVSRSLSGGSDYSAREHGRRDGAGIYRGGTGSKQIGKETRQIKEGGL